MCKQEKIIQMKKVNCENLLWVPFLLHISSQVFPCLMSLSPRTNEEREYMIQFLRANLVGTWKLNI